MNDGLTALHQLFRASYIFRSSPISKTNPKLRSTRIESFFFIASSLLLLSPLTDELRNGSSERNESEKYTSVAVDYRVGSTVSDAFPIDRIKNISRRMASSDAVCCTGTAREY